MKVRLVQHGAKDTRKRGDTLGKIWHDEEPSDYKEKVIPKIG